MGMRILKVSSFSIYYSIYYVGSWGDVLYSEGERVFKGELKF